MSGLLEGCGECNIGVVKEEKLINTRSLCNTGVVVEWTWPSVCILLYYTKGRQVAGLGPVDIQSRVHGRRHALAGPTE